MILLFETPSWLTGFNFLMALFAFLVMAGAALVTLMVKGRAGASELQTDRAVAAEALLKIRDTELVAVREQLKKTETELEDLTAEHRTLAGLTIGELLEHWSQKETLEASIGDLQREIRILKLRKDGDK